MQYIRIRSISPGFGLLLLLSLLLAGCLPRTVVPLKTLKYDLAPGSDKLVVMLPGRGEALGKLKDRGVFETMRSRGYDVVVAGLHLGYYIEGSFIRRLREDVLLPARAKGYKHIWLVGNSMGGNGSLFYIREYPSEIDGVVLLGPYLGEKEIVDEIASAGGVALWEHGEINEGDSQRALWAFIKKMPPGTPPVFMAYGAHDRFSEAQGLLASVLPPGRTVAIEGGHDWWTWKRAWDMLFSRGIEEQKEDGRPLP